MKTCSHCGDNKSKDNYHKSNQTKDKLQNWCKDCVNQDTRQRRAKTGMPRQSSEACRRAKLKEKYCLSLEEYERLFQKVNGCCEICGKEFYLSGTNAADSLCVDHIEGTYLIRGLLCLLCNSAIGKLNHDVNLLAKAVEYCKREPRLTQSQINVMSGIE